MHSNYDAPFYNAPKQIRQMLTINW